MVVLKSFEFHCLTHTHTLCACFIAATSLIESHNRIFIYSHIHIFTWQPSNAPTRSKATKHSTPNGQQFMKQFRSYLFMCVATFFLVYALLLFVFVIIFLRILFLLLLFLFLCVFILKALCDQSILFTHHLYSKQYVEILYRRCVHVFKTLGFVKIEFWFDCLCCFFWSAFSFPRKICKFIFIWFYFWHIFLPMVLSN